MSNSIFNRLKGLFGLSVIDDDFYDELEETLILADVGVKTTEDLIDDLKKSQKENKIKTPDECKKFLIDYLKGCMRLSDGAFDFLKGKSVILMVGVNGVGKTTTTGKLAYLLKNSGKKVLLAAADTFRAGATEQITLWANRTGVKIISQGDGADPAAVVFDAVSSAKSTDIDVLICDTAGRLHNKKNLMDELEKIYRILSRDYGEANLETLLVLDATTGQNAVSQAEEFAKVTKVSGVVLTKMDGTAKGGIAIAIENELGIPIKYIGVGEGTSDLKAFNADEYIDELFN